MTTAPDSPASPASPRQAAVDAALLVLKSMGLSPADLTAASSNRGPVPTFTEYVPVVSGTVTPGTLRAYRPYWRRVVEEWGDRRLDEPTPSEIKQLVAYVRASAVPRRNSRGGRSAGENLISALRCLCRRAADVVVPGGGCLGAYGQVHQAGLPVAMASVPCQNPESAPGCTRSPQ